MGIAGIVLLMNPTSIMAENLKDNLQILGGLGHQLAGVALGDLDMLGEDVWVAEDQLEGGDSHGLGDGDEVEHTLVADAGHVEEALVGVFEGVEDHLGAAVQGYFPVLDREQVVPIVDVLAPDLLGPEAALVEEILVDIANDVGLLQKLAHALGEVGAAKQLRVGELGLDEKASQTFTDEAGDVVTVQLVVLDGVDAVGVMLSVDGIVGHAVAHLDGDIGDDVVVRFLHLLELGDDVVEVNEELTVLLVGAALVKSPTVGLHVGLEVAEERLLLLDV